LRKIRVKVRPNAGESRLEEADGAWVARVRSPPVDGKANYELIGLVAKRFGLPRSRVTIRRGTAGRVKTVELAD